MGKATQSTRQDPQEFSDFSDACEAHPTLKNCTSLPAGKRPASHLSKKSCSHWASENTLETVMLKTFSSFLFNFLSLFASRIVLPSHGLYFFPSWLLTRVDGALPARPLLL